jgi:hypothetical protein
VGACRVVEGNFFGVEVVDQSVVSPKAAGEGESKEERVS